MCLAITIRVTRGETFGGTMSLGQALALLRRDIIDRVQAGLDAVKVDLTQQQVDALADLIFNVGIGNFLP
jgi:GH24 family phage-related lysozyme (muramidase)